jgi:hypothetical protein
MAVGERVPAELLGRRRHGVLVWRGDHVVWTRGTRTRRGASRRYLDVFDWLPVHPGRAQAAPGNELVVVRVARRRVVEERRVRVPGEPPPDAGVREPRRPRPASSGGAAVAEAPDH